MAEESPIQTSAFLRFFQVLTLGFTSDIQTIDPSLTSTPGCTKTPPKRQLGAACHRKHMQLALLLLLKDNAWLHYQGEDGAADNTSVVSDFRKLNCKHRKKAGVRNRSLSAANSQFISPTAPEAPITREKKHRPLTDATSSFHQKA